MADNSKVSSFNESGYFKGRCQLISSDNLAREADEWDKEQEGQLGETVQPINRILLAVLHDAVLAEANYIHINPMRVGSERWSEFLIRYRLGSKLWEANAFPTHVYAPFCARLKIISSVNIAERRLPQFGRFLWEQSHVVYEMRLSSIPTQLGEAFVINILQNYGSGSYTEERHEWLDELVADEIYASILQKRQEKSE